MSANTLGGWARPLVLFPIPRICSSHGQRRVQRGSEELRRKWDWKRRERGRGGMKGNGGDGVREGASPPPPRNSVGQAPSLQPLLITTLFTLVPLSVRCIRRKAPMRPPHVIIAQPFLSF